MVLPSYYGASVLAANFHAESADLAVESSCVLLPSTSTVAIYYYYYAARKQMLILPSCE